MIKSLVLKFWKFQLNRAYKEFKLTHNTTQKDL